MKLRNNILGLAAVCLVLAGCAQEAPSVAPVLPPPTEEAIQIGPPLPTVATLAVCGDTMSHMPITNDVWDEGKGYYDYTRILSYTAPYVEAADYAVANLETNFAGGPKYSGFPAFNTPDDLALGLKETGFDLMLTANNHCLDKRFPGLSRTLDVLDGVGLAHVGTSRTQAEREDNIVVADVGGISIAFLGYTYGTNGIPLPSDAPYAVNLLNRDYLTHLSDLDEEQIGADLAKAEALGTDLIAVMVHWGVEYQTKQNRIQEQAADFLIAHGADLVLGGHSHVPQPVEMRTVTDETGAERTAFVCYSLGNYVSSQNDPLTDTTAVLTLTLQRDNETMETGVTGWSYVPFFMLDREEGAVGYRYELLDAQAVAADEAWDETVRQKCRKAVEDCLAILGPMEVTLP